MTAAISDGLSTAALLEDLGRRERVAHLNDADLHMELERRGARLQQAAWYPPRDDRKDPHVTPGLPSPVLAHGRRVCYLIGASTVNAISTDRVRLRFVPYGTANSLCPSEPFWCQPSVVERLAESYGDYGYTGYLIGPDRVLTCWHGWEYFSHAPQVAIFDYAARSSCDDLVELPSSSVYSVSLYPQSIASTPGDSNVCCGDWVVLKLERPVTDRVSAMPLLAAPAVGRPVYTLGYPCGLPLKLADNARVLSRTSIGFRADLDTYTGNSGSPVFDAETHALLGIVIEAQKDEGDFEPSPTQRCYVSNRIDPRVTGQLVLGAPCFADALKRGR